MKLTSIISVAVLVFFNCFQTSAQKVQDVHMKERPRVVVEDCLRCEDRALSLPVADLPGLIEVKPYKNRGTISVQVRVDTRGNVEKAVAIAGHPFFRPILEKSALKAKFRLKVVDGIPVGFSAIIVYRIVSEDDDKRDLPVGKFGIVNGLATDLPKPLVPALPIDVCIGGPVSVIVTIGGDGLVKEATAISGNKFLQNSAVNAAKLAKFRKQADVPPVKVKGIVVYNFPQSSGCSVANGDGH